MTKTEKLETAPQLLRAEERDDIRSFRNDGDLRVSMSPERLGQFNAQPRLSLQEINPPF